MKTFLIILGVMFVGNIINGLFWSDVGNSLHDIDE